MSKLMRFLFLSLMMASLTSCDKQSDEKLIDATLTGIDFRRCAHPICGGYWILIDLDTLRFLDFPSDSDIGELDVNTEFPIPVEVRWSWPEDENLTIAEDLILVEEISRK